MRKILIPSFMVLCLLCSACGIYKPDIQQGNILESKEVEKLKLGMTTKQVLYVIGTPLLTDPFHKNRWDYIHTLKRPRDKMVRQRLTLYFENGVLVRIDDAELNEYVVK